MAFNDVVFPDLPLIHDRVRTTIDPVSVSTNGSYEYRVKRQKWAKFIWKIPTMSMKNSQKNEVREFLEARSHGLNSFKYFDTEMSNLVDAPMEIDEDLGIDRWYKLTFPLNSTTPGTHPIFNHGTLVVKKNGVIDEFVNIASYDYSKGYLRVLVTNIAGGVATFSGIAYFTVRLDSSFSETLVALCSDNSTPIYHNVDSITLVEVFGEY